MAGMEGKERAFFLPKGAGMTTTSVLTRENERRCLDTSTIERRFTAAERLN